MQRKGSEMDKQELISQIRDAQEQILEAIRSLKEANRQIKDRHAKAYLLDQLDCLASDDHGFLSRDYTISQWIADIESGDVVVGGETDG